MATQANPFVLAEQCYRQLLVLHQQGQLSQVAFQEQQAVCVVQDNQGRRWFPAPEPGRWLLWDGQQWVPYELPAVQLPARRLSVRPRYSYRPTVQQHTHHGWIGWLIGSTVLLLFLGVVGFFIWRSPLPEQWGLRQPVAVRLLDQPDRNTAEELALELSMERDTPGVYYYVLPVKNSSNKILYVIADASAGFDGIKVLGGSSYAVLDYLAQLASNKVVSGTDIVRIALDYRDEQGVQLGVITARTADILAYANHEMTSDELVQVLDGRVNSSAVKKEAQQ